MEILLKIIFSDFHCTYWVLFYFNAKINSFEVFKNIYLSVIYIFNRANLYLNYGDCNDSTPK